MQKLGMLRLLCFLLVGSALISSQTYRQTLSAARRYLAAASTSRYALFGGGLSSAGHTDVDIWDLETGVWTTSTLRTAKYELAATAVGRFVLFAGGRTSSSAASSSEVDIWDTSTNSWSYATLLLPSGSLAPRRRLGATSVGKYALFGFGGFGTSFSSAVNIWDSEQNQWLTGTLLSANSRMELAATSVGNFALFGGGIRNAYAPQSTVNIWNSSAAVWNSWTATTLSIARSALAATSVGKYALFAGGRTDNTAGESTAVSSDVVDIWDSTTRSWIPATTLSIPRYDLSAISVGKFALFAGGRNATTIFRVVDIWNVETAAWSVSGLSGDRVLLSAASVGKYALFGGGTSATAVSATVDMWESECYLNWVQRKMCCGTPTYTEGRFRCTVGGGCGEDSFCSF